MTKTVLSRAICCEDGFTDSFGCGIMKQREIINRESMSFTDSLCLRECEARIREKGKFV